MNEQQRKSGTDQIEVSASHEALRRAEAASGIGTFELDLKS